MTKGIVNRSPSYSSRLLLFYVKPKNRSYILNIHLCHADCHARYIRNTFLRSPRGLFNCLTAFLVSSSAAALSCTGLKCHACFEFNTAKRSFTHVCLIALFSVLVFVFLESDDRSCRRLRHCSLVNSSTLDKIEALQTMKCCTAKRCYAVVNFSFVMF